MAKLFVSFEKILRVQHQLNMLFENERYVTVLHYRYMYLYDSSLDEIVYKTSDSEKFFDFLLKFKRKLLKDFQFDMTSITDLRKLLKIV